MGITNGINPVEIWLFKPKHLYSDRKRLRETWFLGALCLQSERCIVVLQYTFFHQCNITFCSFNFSKICSVDASGYCFMSSTSGVIVSGDSSKASEISWMEQFFCSFFRTIVINVCQNRCPVRYHRHQKIFRHRREKFREALRYRHPYGSHGSWCQSQEYFFEEWSWRCGLAD